MTPEEFMKGIGFGDDLPKSLAEMAGFCESGKFLIIANFRGEDCARREKIDFKSDGAANVLERIAYKLNGKLDLLERIEVQRLRVDGSCDSKFIRVFPILENEDPPGEFK